MPVGNMAVLYTYPQTMDELKKYSNYSQVQRLADRYNVGKVYISTRKGKKYMVQSPQGEMIHFGQLPYEDFTKHKDPERRRLFQIRNAKWKTAPKYTPRWLAYYLLW